MKKKPINNKTKQGAASLYIVIFTALILSVISLSYIRIMLSDARTTTNSDLSESAYDSAMAGLEDGKIALLKYHDCISKGYKDSAIGPDAAICNEVIRDMEEGIKNQSCDVVKDVLNRINGQGETMIEETNIQGDNQSTKLDQAYTCVRISEELKDYRTTLSESDRVRIVPLRASQYQNVERLRISWYSDINANGNNDPNLNKISMLGVELFQTGKYGFNLGELSTSEGVNGTDHFKVFLTPGGGNGDISADTLIKLSDKNENHYVPGKCTHNRSELGGVQYNGFACYAIINIPPTYYQEPRAESTFFLRMTLPYGEPKTDFSVTLCEGTGNCSFTNNEGVVEFTGVQAMIDSTGRANDLYRRVETRVELVDNYFPYPEFAIQLDPYSETGIDKSFWVTRNCWTANNGESSTCPNRGDADTYLY